MFMNYMDYVDDAAMFMFTRGQAERMAATLAGPRIRCCFAGADTAETALAPAAPRYPRQPRARRKAPVPVPDVANTSGTPSPGGVRGPCAHRLNSGKWAMKKRNLIIIAIAVLIALAQAASP
jgi:hypothetical protein